MRDIGLNRFYNAGLAVMIYNSSPDKRTWRYRDEEITLPAGAVAEATHRGLHGQIASIDDIRKAAANG